MTLNLDANITADDAKKDVRSVRNSLHADFAMMMLNIIMKETQRKIIRLIDMLWKKWNALIVNMYNLVNRAVKNVWLSLQGIFVQYVISLMMSMLKNKIFTARVVEFVELEEEIISFIVIHVHVVLQ